MNPPERLVTVFEARNDDLNEYFVGITSKFIDQLIASHEKVRPPMISHWRSGQKIDYRCIEYALPLSQAKEFVQEYAKSLARPGWKVLADV